MFDLVETNYTGGDDSGSAVTHLALRIWRNRPQYRFEGRIHEQKTGNMPTYLPERLGHTGVRMLHYGYLKSRIGAKDKSTRNIELLQQEVRESPKPFALFNLASEYMVLGRWVEARELFDRAWVDVRLEEDWRAIGYVPLLAPRMVTCRRETGKLAEARVGARQALLAYPDHTDVALQLALVERGTGNLDEARRIAERCLEMGDAPAAYSAVVGSGTYLALCLLGELATARGELEEAEELFRRSLRDYPHYVSPILPLAVTMLRRGATPAEVLAEVPEGKPSALLLAATACFEAGHAEEPETWFRTVLERQPANAVARLGRAESLIALKRYAEAADESALALDSALGPQAASVRLFALAAAQDARGLRAALASAFAAGMTAHEAQIFGAWAAVIEGAPLPRTLPADAAATALLGLDALLRVQDFEVFEQLAGLYQATLAPARQKVEDLARLYLRRGFLESAADEWLPFAQRGGDAKAFVGLAQVAFAKGLHEDALGLAREALRLDPGSVEPQRLVRSLESRIATAA